MRTIEVWTGRPPSYWNITPWTTIFGEKIVWIHRHEKTNRRVIESLDLRTNQHSSFETVYNSVLGNLKESILLARLIDARSHIQVSRVGRYLVNNFEFQWESNNPLLVEKFKVPMINYFSNNSLVFSNKELKLENGEIVDHTHHSYSTWALSDDLEIIQKQNELVCQTNFGVNLWSLKGYLGNQYQGLLGNNLVFMKDNKLELRDEFSGSNVEEHILPNLRIITKRVFADFKLVNNRSFDNSTVADIAISKKTIIWITEDNQLLLKNRLLGEIKKINIDVPGELLLSTVSDKYISVFVLRDEDYITLLVIELED